VLPAATEARSARLNYALMFRFAELRGAEALVAIADLTYERFLQRMNIRTRRFGPPQVIGVDRSGAALTAVAGEIPLKQGRQSRPGRLPRSWTKTGGNRCPICSRTCEHSGVIR
jgi:N-acyl-L-homoserine lactone synthetase